MKKKILLIILTIGLSIAFWVFLLFFFFTGHGTGFARACHRIEIGMSKETVISIMRDYENKKGIEYIPGIEGISYAALEENFFADTYQCNISLDNEDRVKSVLGIFD